MFNPWLTKLLTANSCPKLAAKVRLRFDRHSGQYLLIFPERGIQLDATAAEIVKLCDGVRSIATIAQELAQRYAQDVTQIEKDVLELLQSLHDRCVVEDADRGKL